jgi:hypothetical protein
VARKGKEAEEAREPEMRNKTLNIQSSSNKGARKQVLKEEGMGSEQSDSEKSEKDNQSPPAEDDAKNVGRATN